MGKTRGACEEVLIEGQWVIGMPEVDEPEPDEPVQPVMRSELRSTESEKDRQDAP